MYYISQHKNILFGYNGAKRSFVEKAPKLLLELIISWKLCRHWKNVKIVSPLGQKQRCAVLPLPSRPLDPDSLDKEYERAFNGTDEKKVSFFGAGHLNKQHQ